MFIFFNEPYVDFEEELRVKRRRLRDSNNVLDLPKNEFIKEFRVRKEVFKQILDAIAPKMQKRHRRAAVPEMTKLACFMRSLAGNYQKNIGENYTTCESQPLISRIITECLDIFEDYFCSKWIHLEMTVKEENKRKEDFYRKTKLPSLDCTYISIQYPTEAKYLYKNNMGFYSINALIICDANLVIRYVDARYPGENEDSFVWEISAANEYFKLMYDSGKRNFWLVGDSDFQLQPYLMTPYRGSCYNNNNNAISKTDRKMRSNQKLDYLPGKITKLINACCAIHNACVFYKDELKHAHFEDTNLHRNEECDLEMDISEEANEGRQRLTKCLREHTKFVPM